MKKLNRNEYIKEQVKKGASYQDLANELGVSRQRIHQIAQNYTTIDLNNILKKLLKGSTCFSCGKSAVVIHHINGNSRDNGINNLVTLCKEHHVEVHIGAEHHKKALTKIIRIDRKLEFKPRVVKVRIIA